MNEPLAIIGIGCRFPGGASPESFWNMLCAGTDAIREVPSDRWSIAAHYDPAPGRAGKSLSKWGGFIENIDRFDSGFFGISAREADSIDPQQRLLLEASWEAFEDGGQTLEELRSSNTGVFVGISTTDYAAMQIDRDGHNMTDVYTATGSACSIAANRISYCFDLRGPSIAIDTACSSALTACHVACQSLWHGDCSMAVVAGVNALLNQDNYIAFSRMSMLSPDGRCKAFDASANGFVRAEGVGAVVLKPLSNAQAEGDRIYAVIRGTAANQDGRTNGITLPSQQAQAVLIRQACQAANILPGEISYVEAHGTGTAVGDPIEAAALGSVLCEGRRHPCLIGSVKTNIGHLEAASGIASLIKAALILKYRTVPPSLHFKNPNPNINFEKLKLRVVHQLEKLPQRSRGLFAGINSFGFGGANAHVILEAAPGQSLKKGSPAGKHFLLLPISAHSHEALDGAARQYRALLWENNAHAEALCGVAATRRSHLAHRLCLVGRSREDFLAGLDNYLAGEINPAVVAGEAATNVAPVFVFSGQGSQWWGMGRELLREERVFREKFEQCDKLFREFGNWSVMEELSNGERSSRLRQTEIAQTAVFSLQIALAALWQSWGVKPSAVVGHSVGEVAAAHTAGIFTLREAARLTFHRGRSMKSAPETGRMLAAGLDPAQAEEFVARFPGEVAIAAFNGPNSVTFSGEGAPLEEVARMLETRGIFNRFLQVNYAFHSHHMDVAKDELLLALGKLETAPAQLKMLSTVTGTLVDGPELTADYWWRNIRQPVRFGTVIAALSGQGHNLFLELSAHPVLTAPISETLARHSEAGKAFFSLRRNEPELATMFANLSALHVVGSPVNWKAVYPDVESEVTLPLYSWQRERHWRETSTMHTDRLVPPEHPFLTAKVRAAAPVWNAWLDLNAHAWLKDHRVQEHIVFPGAGYVEAALGIGRVLFNSQPLEVEDIEFHKALVLPEGKNPMQLHSVFSPADAAVKFSSRGTEADGEWVTNATAKLRAHIATNPLTMDLKRLQRNLGTRLAKNEVYSRCERAGLFYGPMFRAVETVWRKDGEAMGRVELPEQLVEGSARFQIHPVLLDACFQVLLCAKAESRDQRLLLPTRLDRVTFHARPGKSVFCHGKIVQASSHAITWDFQVFDETGRVLLNSEGFRVQAVRGMSASRLDGPDNWLYETKWVARELSEPGAPTEKPLPGIWLLFADSSGVAEKLSGLLKQRGGDPLLFSLDRNSQHPGAYGFEKLRELLGSTNRASRKKVAGVIHLGSLDAPDPTELDPRSLLQAEADGCHSVLRLAQSMVLEKPAPPLWLVTRGAQGVNAEDRISVAQAPILGLGRTIMTELPQLSCRLVDLSFDDAGDASRLLLREILSGEGETEVAWRGESRFASRIARTSLEAHPPRTSAVRNPGYRLETPASGIMDELALLEHPRRKPGAHEVEIEICAAALNFRDVMKLLGIYPMNSDLDLSLGDECSGRIVALGNKVKSFKIGDEVIAIGSGCFASHLTVPESSVVRKPMRIPFEEAATIPVAFMTAWYALHQLGKIQRGERILIHAAAGGVGLAAVQIARLAGTEIFATAGNDEKRNYLRKLGIRHVMDSRSTAFAAEIRRLTRGKGVDLVLNSLAGDAIAKGLATLAPGGRFLEIGKRDIYANTAIGLRPLRNNCSMFVIDMGQVMVAQSATVQSLLQTIMKLMRGRELHPLPHHSWPVSQASNAFHRMVEAKHIGKIVLTMQGEKITPKQMPGKKRLTFSAKAAYLIIGGLGGFGLVVAKWLLESGARHLVLSGRKGAGTPETKRAVADLKRLGAKVAVVRADVTDEGDVARIFQVANKLGPLRGIFHSAMVLDDAVLPHLTAESFSRVTAPKVSGSWNLHRASAGLPLDHFVMFSSVSALIGAAGQANYAAANCFLDALALYRRASGLPALTVNWGALSEVGFVASHARVAEHLTAHGVQSITPAQATEMLGRLLQSDVTQIAFMRVDWEKFFGTAVDSSPSPRFSEIIAAPAQRERGDAGSIRRMILSTTAAERLALVVERVAESAAKVLRTSPAKLEANRPLEEMGLDSLMAFELLNRLEVEFGISWPSNNGSANSSINHLAAVVLKMFVEDGADPGTGQTLAAAIGRERNESTEAAVRSQQILTLRSGGDGTPVFFIHPAGGGTNIYDALVEQVPEGFPVYGIQSRILVGADDEFSSVEEMARNYASLITKRQTDGALRLAGFSAGGLFALATAGELERRGRTVSFVGMIDTPVGVFRPDYPRELVLKNLLVEFYDHLSGEPALLERRETGDLLDSMMELARKTATAKEEAARLHLVMDWLVKHGVHVGNGADSVSKRFLELFIRHASLISAGRLETVTAPVWLWHGAASFLPGSPIARETRGRITRGKLVEEVLDGGHFELMHRPLVKTLAARLSRVLAETEEAHVPETVFQAQMVT
jgi:acyl transferase domain-containing protein/thioesterase domain-containing protein/acyl carrier protein